MNMSIYHARKRKPALSDHQKQMRFLTGLSMFVSLLIMTLLFWAVNWMSRIH